MPTFTTIAAFTNPLEAHIARGRLDAENIQAFIVHEQQIWNQWHLSNALGGVRLQVLEKDEKRARSIIESHLGGEYEQILEDDADFPERNACPKCRSTVFSSRFPYSLIVLMIFTLGLCGIIFPVRKDIHICRQCGSKWCY